MKHIVIALALGLTACGCSTYSKYSRPENIVPENLYGDIAPTDTAGIASIPWRDFYRDADLRALIDSGLANNSDLKTASLRVAEAEAALSSARLAYLPAVSLTPQGSVSVSGGENMGSTYSLGLAADWEADIAGRLTNEKRGAVATLRQQRSYRRAVSSQLIATIANSYFSLLSLDRQIALSKESLGAWDEIIRTLEARKRVGEANEAAVSQAKASKYEVENSILSLSQQLRTIENSLCALLGRTPGTIARGELQSQTFPDSAATGVPLRLLENRPDVQEAEYALQAAFYATGVARAAFYPSLTLSGTFGWTNNSGAAISNPGNWLLNALASLTQPVFNKGRNTANLKIARARQEEALTAFRQKLLDAGAEVNNALVQCQTARQRLDISNRQIEALESAMKSTLLLMKHSDNSSYLEVLTARQTLLAARLSQAQQTFDAIQGKVKLYHALGGGAVN